MKIQSLHSIVAVQCATLPNLLIFPNFQASKCGCCPGTTSANISTKPNFRFAQFDSIANRDEWVALIWPDFRFCWANYCEDTTLWGECKWTNHPVGNERAVVWTRSCHGIIITKWWGIVTTTTLTIFSILLPFKCKWVSFLTRSILLSFLRTYMLFVPSYRSINSIDEDIFTILLNHSKRKLLTTGYYNFV